MRILTAITILLSMTVYASAAEIDFSQVLLDPDSKPYRDCVKQDHSEPANPRCAEWIDHTLGLISYSALDVPDKNLTLADQARRGLLARKVYHAGRVDVNAAEITLIVDQINKLGLRPAETVAAIEKLDPSRLK